jgi:methionine-rich copper-binding protein CopC
MRSSITRRVFATCAFAIAASLAWRPAPAGAFHLKLLRSSPAKDTTVGLSPREIRLWFSTQPELKLTTIHLTGISGADVPLAALTGGPGKEFSVGAAIKNPLVAGRYQVAWRTMSSDGHVVKGEYAFAVAASSPPRASRGSR